MHVIAANAISFLEAIHPEFRVYQEQVLKNSSVLAKTLSDCGLHIVSDRTESHQFLVDLRPINMTGKEADAALSKANITVNKNAISNEPQNPLITS